MTKFEGDTIGINYAVHKIKDLGLTTEELGTVTPVANFKEAAHIVAKDSGTDNDGFDNYVVKTISVIMDPEEVMIGGLL